MPNFFVAKFIAVKKSWKFGTHCRRQLAIFLGVVCSVVVLNKEQKIQHARLEN